MKCQWNRQLYPPLSFPVLALLEQNPDRTHPLTTTVPPSRYNAPHIGMASSSSSTLPSPSSSSTRRGAEEGRRGRWRGRRGGGRGGHTDVWCIVAGWGHCRRERVWPARILLRRSQRRGSKRGEDRVVYSNVISLIEYYNGHNVLQQTITIEVCLSAKTYFFSGMWQMAQLNSL
jgi:hypothetical protein